MAASASSVPLSGTLDVIDGNLDKIINIGKKVWKVIDNGKPVGNVQSDSASALPQGTHNWTDLERWSAPQAKTYVITYSNAYGMEIIRFSYRIVYVTGGSFNGKGAYIGYASIQPADLEVLWSNTFNAEVSTVSVSNMGTKADPVASLVLQLKYTVDNKMLPVKAFTGTKVIHISGRGEFKMLD
jgi:hypothetical protein